MEFNRHNDLCPYHGLDRFGIHRKQERKLIMKTVFDNRQAAHVWAQQNQPSGRSSNGNLFFEGKTIYSYGYHFPIASFITHDTVLVNSDSYSISTSKHQNYVAGAISHKNRLHVSTRVIKAFSNEREFGPNTRLALSNDAIDTAKRWIEKAAKRKARKFAANDLVKAQSAIQAAEHIFTYFDAAPPKEFNAFKKTLSGDDVQKVIAAEKSRLDKEEKARIKREKEAQEKLKASCLLWAEFKEHDMPVYQSKKIYMRINGDEIETTKGARFPVTHAIPAFKMIRHAHENKKDMDCSSSLVRLGHFKIDHVDAQGNVKAGCHYVEWDEIERIARILKIYP